MAFFSFFLQIMHTKTSDVLANLNLGPTLNLRGGEETRVSSTLGHLEHIYVLTRKMSKIL